jgi:spore coat polysaccharide biosynthesis protein SpsF (cytidylyltransferase family)
VSVIGPHDLGHWRWTVDSAEDLAFVRGIYERLGDDDTFAWHDVRRLLEQETELADINRHVRQKQIIEG